MQSLAESAHLKEEHRQAKSVGPIALAPAPQRAERKYCLHEIDGDPVNPYQDIDGFRAPRNRYPLRNRMIQLIEHSITRSTETPGMSGTHAPSNRILPTGRQFRWAKDLKPVPESSAANRRPTVYSHSKKSRAL